MYGRRDELVTAALEAAIGPKVAFATLPRAVVSFDTMTDAVTALREWTDMYGRRDELVTAALEAGIGVNEITRITGLAKTTVLRIKNRADVSQSDTSQSEHRCGPHGFPLCDEPGCNRELIEPKSTRCYIHA